MALRGDCFRHQEGRLTQRICLGEKYYFIKQHRGIGWRDVFKNILQARLPVISAKNEYLAILKLNADGIATPKIVGYGCSGWNPAKMQSFILMEELAPTISLEDLANKRLSSRTSALLKRQLITEVARITRQMHALGMNHRDLYICHFLLQLYSKVHHQDDPMIAQPLRIYLIDLHRAQIRKKTPFRWRVKDLAGLYFSSNHIRLTNRDRLRFIREYSQQSLKKIFKNKSCLWQQVKIRGEKLYNDHR